MFHRPALLRSTCTKRVEVSLTPTLILEEEKDKGTAKQSHSSGTETELRPVLRSMGKLFAAPSTNPAANATAVPTALHRGRDTAS